MQRLFFPQGRKANVYEHLLRQEQLSHTTCFSVSSAALLAHAVQSVLPDVYVSGRFFTAVA